MKSFFRKVEALLQFDADQEQREQPKRERPRCGARTRKGTPCQAPCYWPKGASAPRKRCRMHGGLSTGPRTPEGRQRIAESNRRRAAQTP